VRKAHIAAIIVLRKKRGRPATGEAPILAVRLSHGLRARIDAWATHQNSTPSRSEAIRRLLEYALSREEKTPNGEANEGLSGSQIRAARALLKWSAADLARKASLGVNTIGRAELADHVTSLTVANELAIRRALEDAGVEFIDENGGGSGVRLRKPYRNKG
jgi:ribosome-binding protein aMBF1 (putative translation factor)